MNEKNEVFKKLLPINELFMLYQRLSETIITKIDVKSLSLNPVAVDNSINLLCELEMIQFNQGKNAFQRMHIERLEFSDFSEILYAKLRLLYAEAFLFINQADLKYDEIEAKLYIKRNSVSLDLSGLLMLLDGMGKIEIKQNDVFFLDKSLLDCRMDVHKHATHNRTLEGLKKQLEINEKFGVEAELAAMEYEINVLKNVGISKSPERISEFNVSAGYDIISFAHKDSLKPDKFIEVKSCSDDSWIFYISRNELDVAKIKQDNYYLYLYNRKSQKFRIIQNPYDFFVENESKNQWAMNSQIYEIRSLEGIY